MCTCFRHNMMNPEYSHKLEQLLEIFLLEWEKHRETLEKNKQIRCDFEVKEEKQGLTPILMHRIRKKHRQMQK